MINERWFPFIVSGSLAWVQGISIERLLMKGDRTMKTKKTVLTSLECINENLNTLILNQEMAYFTIQEILKKMGQPENRRRVTVRVRRKKI